ncbi:sodium/solute symporter [Ruminococcus sp. NK3A76]|uniref:sodium:solute symporter family transporter n=1 Tax=Ruminococcus sp. NK3A76 TaxID=877411 RepID=UPI00048CF7A4|nr:sodium/solute symporter [Ruminococcus sp. NK3A76]
MVTRWIVLCVYLILMVGIGVYYKRKTASVSDFVLGGRALGPWFTAFAYGTSYFSAVIFVGYAGKFGWAYGVASTWIGIGNAVIGSLLAWLILGKRTRAMTKHIDAKTMPEFFEKRFNSKTLKTVSALIIFIFLIPYTASVYNGLSRLFEKSFHIDYEWCIVAMAIFTAVYVIMGGYKATALNDFIQGIIMLIGIVAVVVAVLNVNGGFSGSLEAMGVIPDANGNTEVYNSLMGPDPVNLVGVIILTSLGTWGLPQMVQKFYAIKDDKAVVTGTVVSTVFAVVVAGGCYFLGGFGRLFMDANEAGAPVEGFDAIVPSMMDSLSSGLFALIIVLVLSASMSTLSSLVLTSSSTLTIDLIKPLKKNMSDKEEVRTMRIFIAVFLLISVSIAVYSLRGSKQDTMVISSLMGISWGALAGAFLAPFMYGLFWKGVTKAAVMASFICGVGITVVHMLIYTFGIISDAPTKLGELNLASPVNAGAFTMLLGLVVVPVVSLITKQNDEDKALTEEMFKCYQA